jgi:DNA-binding NarL/FixJ family response regulator
VERSSAGDTSEPEHAQVRGPSPIAAPPRAVVADELALARLGVIAVLEPLGVDVVAETHGGRDAAQVAAVDAPELVVFGALPDLPAPAALRRLQRVRPRPAIVALLAESDRPELGLLLAMGVDGVAARSGRPEELAAVVERVLKGERAIAPALRGALAGAVAPRTASGGAGLGLTRREREILVLVAEGRSNREIAGQLSVTLATVKSHLVHLYAKLGAGGREEAMARAVTLGLLG